MGCNFSSSKVYTHIYEERSNIKNLKPAFDKLRLVEAEVGKLYKVFESIGLSNTGYINAVELLIFLRVESSKTFVLRLFEISLKSEDGHNEDLSQLRLNFETFVLTVHSCCIIDPGELGM